MNPRTQEKPQLRHFPMEFRAATEGEPEGTLVGYASVYDVEYRIGWGMSESITPGAFDTSLAGNGGVLPIFYQHDWSDPIGTAVATSDSHGVKVTASLFIDTNPKAMSVYRAAKAGALREWSIGFYPSTLRTEAEEPDHEHVDEGDLAEASVVVRGANPATEMLDVRSSVATERDADPDEDPAALAQAIDAVLDEVQEALAAGDVEAAIPLVTAAEVAVDALLLLLGVPDEYDTENGPAAPATDSAPGPIEQEVENLITANSDREWVREWIRDYYCDSDD